MSFETSFNRAFNFTPMPADLIFGNGAVSQLPDLLARYKAAQVMVVTDPGIRETSVFDRVSDILTKSGADPVIFDRVKADSGSELVMEGARKARTAAIDVVIGLGGGSALDSAKAIAAMATNDGHIVDYAGLGKFKVSPLPTIAVPTASGTGSEVSVWSVMTNDDTGVKISVGGQELIPNIALGDPELSYGLPPALTAAVGMDALGHALECFTNRACQPVSGSMAYHAISLIGQNLRRAVDSGTNVDARYGMMLASTMAGIAMNPTRLGLAHALAMPLGSYDIRIHHGTIIAVTLAEVTRFNQTASPDRYHAVAAALDEPSGDAADAVAKLADDVGIPEKLGPLGLREAHIPSVVAETMKSGNVAVNPRDVTADDVERLLRGWL